MNIEEYSKYIDNIKDMNKEELQDYILQYFETLKIHHNIEDELQDRIDKAIEYIEETWKKESYYEDIENCVEFATINEIQKNTLLDILKGDNK